jgi:CheY-like chemotaxis protein
MQNLSIPTCYFPSTVLFLDDNRDFLLNFVLQLDEGLAYRIFDNPTKALNYLHNKHLEFSFLENNCAGEYDKAKKTQFANGDLSDEIAAINAEVYNPNRFAEVSVVVVDYAMPGMDGLEFCRRIENPKIKKILLTGQADETLAVEAFNEGLIDRYIKKNDTHAIELITKSIEDLQAQYFNTISLEIERMLSINPPACLKDEGFIHFFKNVIAENHIVEYYLAEKSGSFFMLDEDANTSFLIVKNERDMVCCQELALSHGVDKDVLSGIASRNKIPVIWGNNALNLTKDDWASCLFPAEQLHIPSAHYYTYLKGNDLFNVRQPKILSYNRYLEELDAEELLMD